MSKRSAVLAFDLGASSGRAVLGTLNKNTGRLELEEIQRFPNHPVYAGDHLYWDILRLLHELKQGIVQTKRHNGIQVESIGIDSWAVDFGLLGSSGQLLSNPYHYRDRQTDGMMEEAGEKLGRERIFQLTGLQFLPFNTIYQLYAMEKRGEDSLRQATRLLMIPELLRYFLSGEPYSEYTQATASQLFNPAKQAWEYELTDAIGVSRELFLPPVAPGTPVGSLRQSVASELGVGRIPLIAVGEHDTASAVAGVPALPGPFAYLICGTWSLLGTELDAPVMSGAALERNFTNEGGVYGTYRLLKNIMGLWLLQECKRQWDQSGEAHSFEELVRMAEQAPPFQALIDPDHAMFLNPANMPEQILHYCRLTNQPSSLTKGELVRCILESLALKYRMVLEQTEALAGQVYEGLHMVGGGIHNKLLCQFTASATGRTVWAGPAEASAIGNILVQMITLGQIADLEEGRAIVRRSFGIEEYEPVDEEKWDEAYAAYLAFERSET